MLGLVSKETVVLPRRQVKVTQLIISLKLTKLN